MSKIDKHDIKFEYYIKHSANLKKKKPILKQSVDHKHSNKVSHAILLQNRSATGLIFKRV